MSIVRAALRMCAVEALRGATWAQDRVLNSDNRPLLDMLQVDAGEGRPFIVVFTDNDNYETGSLEHGLYSAARSLQLTLEIGVASAIMGKTGEKQMMLEQTDAARELTIDILQAQALAAVHGDPRNEWGEICRDLIYRIVRVTSPRSGNSKGIKWSARQVVITVDTISDMVPGDEWGPEHPIRRFIALAKAENPPGTAKAAALLEQALEQYPYHEPRASWEKAQAMLGLTRRGIRATGIAPLVETPEGPVPWATQVGVSIVGDDNEAPPFTRVYGDDDKMPGAENFVADQGAEPPPEDPPEESLPWPIPPLPSSNP